MYWKDLKGSGEGVRAAEEDIESRYEKHNRDKKWQKRNLFLQLHSAQSLHNNITSMLIYLSL